MNNTEPHDFSVLEQNINYTFRNKSLLEMAMTHSSRSNELHSKYPKLKTECNERLEFFGDSILSLVVSEYLYKSYPELPEGDLSKIRAGTVCEKTLARFAHAIDLGNSLLLGHGEERTNGRERPSILSDAFEALLAAMYLDGGIDAVKAFLRPVVIPEIKQIIQSGNIKDFKTSLQQIVQQEHGEILEYKLVAETGPAHCKTFEVEACLNSNVIGRGKGQSKREAEQNAAKEALQLFGQA